MDETGLGCGGVDLTDGLHEGADLLLLTIEAVDVAGRLVLAVEGGPGR